MANERNGWSRGNGREEEWLSPFASRGRIGTPRRAFGTGHAEEFLPLPWASTEEEVLETPSYELEEEEEGEVVLLGGDGRELETELYESDVMESDEELETDGDRETDAELEMDESEPTMESLEGDEASLDSEANLALEDVDEVIEEWEGQDELRDEETEWNEAYEWEEAAESDEAADWEDASGSITAGIKAGSETIEKVPLLQTHKGIGPDLILLWNDMPAAPSSVDVVVHLHGYSLEAGRPLDIAKDLRSRSGLDWSDPQQLSASPGRTRPTLALLPRGNFARGKSGRKYDFPALVTEGGLRDLVDFGRQRLATSLGLDRIAVDRLIVTAHSGGGAPLMRILGHNDPHEVHVFDGLYGNADSLIAWARSRVARDKSALSGGESAEQYMPTRGGALRVLYRGGTGTAAYSERVGDALRKAIPANSPLRRWYRVERTSVGHLQMPPGFGWRFLADASANVPKATSARRWIQQEWASDEAGSATEESESPFDEAASASDEMESSFDEAEYAFEDEEYAGDEEGEAPNAVSFPSGESLPVLTGYPEGHDEVYWDPTKSGNPLLDTGAAHKDKKLSRSFTVRELTWTGGRSADVARIDPKLVENLQRLRDHVGKDVKVTSGYRSWKRNKEVYARYKKKPTLSQHCGGRGADVKIAGMSGLEIGKAAIDACGPNIGIGLGREFAHIDVRGHAAVWPYEKIPAGWVAEITTYRTQRGGSVKTRPSATHRADGDATLPAAPGLGRASGTSGSLRHRIVQVALKEYALWDSTGMQEHEPQAASVLQRYHKVGVNKDVSAADLTDKTWHDKHPWSAVFISYVMRTAGAGKSFRYSGGHSPYICAAQRARAAGDAGQFWAYRRDEAKPEVGDLVCKDRENTKKKVCYGTTYESVCNGGHGHCDIVVSVDPAKRRIRVIGGNVNQNVDDKFITLTADGLLPEADKHGCRFFGVLKPPGGTTAAASPPATAPSAPATGVPALKNLGAGVAPPSDPSAYRQFRLTTYHVVDESDFPSGAVRVPIYDETKQPLAQVSPELFAKLALEGTARLNDGRLINVTGKTVPVAHQDFDQVLAYHKRAYAKRDEQRRRDGKAPISYGYSGLVVEGGRVTRAFAFHEVPSDKRGVGYGVARGIPHTPFRTLAADIGTSKYSNVEPKWKGRGGLVPAGTRVYIKEYDGLHLPDGSTHDGWFVVNDTGGAIFGAHFDVFVGSRQLAKAAGSLPASGNVWFADIENRVPAGYSYGLKG